MNQAPVFRDVILAGGGHSHALVIRRWGMQPLPGVRLTLISPAPLTPYSGMLPGFLAGHYRHDEMHIDLVRLCQWAGVRLLLDCVTGLDTSARTVLLAQRPAVGYDLLSLDTGAGPAQDVPGVAEFAIPVKPIAGYIDRWQAVLQQLRAAAGSRHLVMVGGGAGSVDALLAMAHATSLDPAIRNKPRFTLVTRNRVLLPGYPDGVRNKVLEHCRARQIEVLTGFAVEEVHQHALLGRHAKAPYEFDHLFWCTGAAAPGWLRGSGLALSDAGFVRIADTLQSSNTPGVFAAGDVSHLDSTPLPKAGVFAVREAPVLFANLRHALLGEALQQYKPQRHYLSLLALGGKVAAGSRCRIVISGAWAWRWKNRIDQAFMARFVQLPPGMPATGPVAPSLIPADEAGELLSAAERCGACGGKLGAGILEAVLLELHGRYQPADASGSAWPDAQLLQSIDQLKAPFADLYRFGRIATRHALNDLYAVNAQPRSLLISVGLPFAGRAVQVRELRQLMQGVAAICREEAVELLGGHSAESPDATVTVAVNGSPGERPFSKRGLQAGQVLILGKPLGSGIVLAALMQNRLPGAVFATALAVMDSSPRPQARWLAEAGVNCCTDISGFGLLGHLDELLAGTGLRVALELSQVPVLPGVLALAERGVRSSLFLQNEARALQNAQWRPLQRHALWPVLLDPQTSGGLLAAIEPRYADAAQAVGFTIVGEVLEGRIDQ